ncbi:hypothetical protein SRCM100730_04006 [Bacillus velezensis]|jgi:hypothetical protein|uniref:hypothetical protein n=1 Tax=Bacillus subtilis group TaxID=653685 RepID=UPI0007F8D706|nr:MULTISPECIES: hypothetical protein [Bacillus subtilis group]MEC0446174.1 hypothetical protein [Bacillus velezensis]OBR31533.1 hypothetical protein SRCM100731_02752 [Bacillus velezensis]OCB92350.1 hypothetical protein SRCM100730_04006 [Bacillus velezensis]RHJ09032.1 hypothetical protein DW143_13730 [Bacillus sonorensis]WPP36690.1 hypothetical protein SK061_24515 [Bacillus sonorensis]
MSLIKGELQPIFSGKKVRLHSYLPRNVQVPTLPEGVSLLTITNCLIKPSSQGYNLIRERIEIDFIDEEKRPLKQIFYLDTGMVNFAKFVDNILGEVPIEDFDLNTLVGVKVKAFIFHNYLSNGKGYANIASCELYQENQPESETR